MLLLLCVCVFHFPSGLFPAHRCVRIDSSVEVWNRLCVDVTHDSLTSKIGETGRRQTFFRYE